MLAKHYAESLHNFASEARILTSGGSEMTSRHTKNGFSDIVKLGRLTIESLPLHRKIRSAIRSNNYLPEVVRNDSPSLRSILWMVLIREIVDENSTGKSENELASSGPGSYPYLLYALTRCFLNGMDDVMDQTKSPITKGRLISNDQQCLITEALAHEFRSLNRREPSEIKGRVKDTVTRYRLTRDNWVTGLNEQANQHSQNFDSAMKYNAEAMGPITCLLADALLIDRKLNPDVAKRLNRSLTHYACAGKLIDDMTDWLKDSRRNQPNLFNLALQESDELDRVVKYTNWVKFFGKKAFVPITLFKFLAPKATERCFTKIDEYISQLENVGFPRLTTSMKAVRQAMWVYAINEGLPQV